MAFWETQVNSVLGTSVGTLLAIKPKRTFASFSGFVSITESHSTATEATSYPIEDGTQGTDHIIRKPDALSWELAFMPESDPETMFRKLRELQMSGEPFDADTGLKRYTNLVILSLACTQDAHSGRICRVNISMAGDHHHERRDDDPAAQSEAGRAAVDGIDKQERHEES